MAVRNIADYGAIGNATYYNPADFSYYANAAFTTIPHDNTAAFRAALAAAVSGDTVLIPIGTYMIKGSLEVPSGVTLAGENELTSKIILGNGFSLNNYYFRASSTRTGNTQAIITTAVDSQNILMRDFTLEGNKNVVIYADWGMAGILCRKTKNVKLHHVHVDWINIRENLSTLFEGWSITATDSDGIEFYRCSGSYSGYQIFGFFDRCKNGVMRECTSGMGWRTSVQVHRDCTNIQILDSQIIQLDNAFATEPHAAVTFHGEEGEEVRDILLQGCYIESGFGFKAAVQAFRQSEGLRVLDNVIKANGEGVHVGEGYNATVERNEITYIPSDKELFLGKRGISIVGGTNNSTFQYNEISGFDAVIGTDTTIFDNHIQFNGQKVPSIHKVKLVRHVDGEILEGFPVVNIDGQTIQSEAVYNTFRWE